MLVKFLILTLIFINQSLAVPNVCTTIKPINSLVASVMKDVALPQLIIDNNHSLHDYMLKPSDAQKIAKADIIFMVSHNFEQFMHKVNKSSVKKNKIIVELAIQPEIKLLPARFNNLFNDGQTHMHDHNEIYDYHIWLDPDNAIAMVKAIASILSNQDPVNKNKYQENAEQLITKLHDLDADLLKNLTQIKDMPYLVFHDAYQYFEQRYDLKSLGSITLNPEYTPSPKVIKKLKKLITQNKVKCIFSEPQFPPTIVNKIAVESEVTKATLDPEWEQTSLNIFDSYFALMRNLTNNLCDCLGK